MAKTKQKQNKEVTTQSHWAELIPGWWSLPLNWAANPAGRLRPGKSFKVQSFSQIRIRLQQMLQLGLFFYLIDPLTHCHSHQVDYSHKNNWTNCWSSGLLFGFWSTGSLMGPSGPLMKKSYINTGSSKNVKCDGKLCRDVSHTEEAITKHDISFIFP